MFVGPCIILLVVTCIRIPPYSSRTAPIHTETEQYIYIQSPAPEDECNNIRNMLSNKKLSWSDIKLVQFIQLNSLYLYDY